MSLFEANHWDFGGPLAGMPAQAGWTIFFAAAGLCALLAWISYRTSVQRLGVVPSTVLMLLRTAFLFTLLLCLANPVRVEKQTREPPPPPPTTAPTSAPRLALVVDRSDSMTLADNRGRSRLDEALASWRRLEKPAQKAFPKIDYYSVAQDLRPAPTLDEALARTGGTDGSALYRSIGTLLKKSPAERPATIVVLTDGVDTSNDYGAEALLREDAVANGVQIYFIAGTNRMGRPEPFLRVREWRVPATQLRNTGFSLEVAFEAFSRADRTVPYSIWQAGRRVGGGDLQLTIGSNVVATSVPVTVGEPGPVEFEVRLGAGDRAAVAARAVTQVVEPRSKRISVLIYEGELDWGFRHMTEALRTDDGFQFITLINGNAGITFAGSSTQGGPRLGRLPERVAAYQPFNCVVLVRPDPRKISPVQQEALTEFVRQGGSVFFVSPDPAAFPFFGAGAFREILPVLIDPQLVPMQSDPKKLVPMELTDAGSAKPIFRQANGGGTLLPRFTEYAAAVRAKPGTEILGVHPTAIDRATGQKHILFATQTFGRGRSALLATDTLWRWKLDEPSTSRAIETFWQQALFAIGQPPEVQSMRFLDVPAQATIDKAITLRLAGTVGETTPDITAKAPNGRITVLRAARTTDADAPWSVGWTPDQAGNWELTAQQTGSYAASAFPSVVTTITGELAPSAPALDAMAALAGDTGGKLLHHEPPLAWLPEEAQKAEAALGPVTTEHRKAQWSNWALLLTALGIYAAELVLRRCWKLL